jgi:hypothetical protein
VLFVAKPLLCCANSDSLLSLDRRQKSADRKSNRCFQIDRRWLDFMPCIAPTIHRHPPTIRRLLANIRFFLSSRKSKSLGISRSASRVAATLTTTSVAL